MVIFDFSQIMMATFFAHIQYGKNYNPTEPIQPDILKYMILNTLRAILMKFKSDNHDKLVVIACDSKTSWRKNEFPFYKAARKKTRDQSDIDWSQVFPVFESMIQDIKDNFPYIVIDVESAEADDAVGVLTKTYNDSEIIIVSADSDFKQLHRPGVKQWDSIRQRFVSTLDPKTYLLEHILKGDRGDGVPNVLSDGNCFVLSIRQKPLRQKKIDQMVEQYQKINTEMVDWDPIVTNNFIRNRTLIDLDFVPSNIKDTIINQFETQKRSKKSNVLNYLIKNNMPDLIEKLQEFH